MILNLVSATTVPWVGWQGPRASVDQTISTLMPRPETPLIAQGAPGYEGSCPGDLGMVLSFLRVSHHWSQILAGLFFLLWKAAISSTRVLWFLAGDFPYQASNFVTNGWCHCRDAILPLCASVAQFARKRMSYFSESPFSSVPIQVSVSLQEALWGWVTANFVPWARERRTPSLSAIITVL